MKAPSLTIRFLAVCFAFASLIARADTLYFEATLDSMGNVNESWVSQNNWYFQLTPTKVQATHLPGASDTAIVQASEYAVQAGGNQISVQTLITAANIVGGDFTAQTINSVDTTFNGSTLNVTGEWQSSGDQLVNASVNILSGALLFLNGATLYLDNSTLYDIGQIELMSDSSISLSSGTNQLSITSGAQLTSIGNNSIENAAGVPLIFDNNGIVQSEDGTFTFLSDAVFWTNSLGKGYFTNITSDAVIEVFGPFAVQTNCTNFINGPGTFLLWNGGIATINGILQIGLGDPSPGTLDFHAETLNGTGAVNITGAPGQPSSLIWESGTFTGPPVNIDSNSLLIISNIYSKTIAASVVNNAGTATWLTDGDDLYLDNGGVFNNLPGALFDAQNSASIYGGAGSNKSFFYNAGTFRKSVSTNSGSFLQDNNPAPSAYFLNLGLLDIQTGAFYLESGTNSGQYNVTQGAQLYFWTGTNSQKSSATYTGPGQFIVEDGDFWLLDDIQISNLFLESAGYIDGPGALTVNGSLTVAAGVIQGSGSLVINPQAAFLLTNGPINLARNVTNAGYALITNNGINAMNPLIWDNLPSGVLNLAGVGLGNIIGYSGPPPVILNAGSLSNSGSAVLTTTINWNVTNSGSVVVNPYAMDFDQSLTQTSGSIDVNPSATLSVSSSFGNRLNIKGGVLEGQGTVSGYIINSGTVHPGNSPGILNLGFGYLTNEPGAQLAIDIAGPDPGLQYSQLACAGSQLWLSNMTLAVTCEGFDPIPGQSFVIISNAQIHGKFASITDNLASRVILVPKYSASSVALFAVNPLIPAPTIISNTFTFGFLTTAGVTNLVEYSLSLDPPNWLPLTNFIGDGLAGAIIDPSATNTTRFYRVIIE